MIDVTCAIILDDEGKILATQRGENMSLPFKWEFPGGKVNEGEDYEDCIVRELREELNISVQVVRRLKDYPYHYEHFSINLVPFIVKHIHGEIQLSEHKEARWLGKEELQSLDWAAADIPIVNDIILLPND